MSTMSPQAATFFSFLLSRESSIFLFLPCNFHDHFLASIPHHSTSHKRHKHIRLVKSVLGPLSRLWLEFSGADGISDHALTEILPFLGLLHIALLSFLLSSSFSVYFSLSLSLAPHPSPELLLHPARGWAFMLLSFPMGSIWKPLVAQMPRCQVV
jgi:hypothetical protein